MKLLFDENLSFKLCKRLEDIYPNSTHVSFAGLQNVDDFVIWQYAKDNNFVIVSQDSDFNDLSVLKGFPPFVVWIKSGNTRVSDIEISIKETLIKSNYF